MQIDTEHVDEDLYAELEKRGLLARLTVKLDVFRKRNLSELLSAGFIDKIKSASPELWELRVKLTTPVRLLCRYSHNILIVVGVYIKKREGPIPRAVISKAAMKASECERICDAHK